MGAADGSAGGRTAFAKRSCVGALVGTGPATDGEGFVALGLSDAEPDDRLRGSCALEEPSDRLPNINSYFPSFNAVNFEKSDFFAFVAGARPVNNWAK